MILNAVAETMAKSAKELLQSQKLQQLIERVYEKTAFYEKSITVLGLRPADIQKVQDIQKLPFMNTTDLQNNYPFGLLTMPVSGVARFEQTVDGKIVNGFTLQDLICQEELIARTLVACYITRTSALLNLPADTNLLSARVLQQSAETLGVTVLSDQTDDNQNKLNTILNFGITTLFGSPEALLAFADFLASKGITNKDLPLMNILCAVQSNSLNVINELKTKFKIPVYSLYGRLDIMSLGIAGECYEQQGLHIHDDHFYPEIIDPNTGEILSDNQVGELVITTISREATPLIRYRTGERAALNYEVCACGRTSPRIFFQN